VETSEGKRTLACFSGWDTREAIDGYNLREMRELQMNLEDGIARLIQNDPNQLSLF
jgi:hypothetical protein